jgi:thiosulfate reductase cytochrome b subunit
LPLRVSGPSGTSFRLTPANPVSRWYWASGDSREPLPREVLEKALLVNGHYRPELVAALDQNHDGKLELSELKLDTKAKRQAVEQLLLAAGVKNPTIRSEVNIYRISHGVAGKKQALSDCAACHEPNSRLKDTVVLASYAPGGQIPPLQDGGPLSGRIVTAAKGALILKPEPGVEQTFHVFGSPARNWPDQVGLLMLIGVVLAVVSHAGYRLVTRNRRVQHALNTRREYLFTAYERLWHWVMALSVLALILTGLQIHFPGKFRFLGAASAVTTHNYFAVVFMVNAFLALFYHLATAAIRQFLPRREGLAEEITLQTKYYLRDIFKGLPAPFPRSSERKLNALQQVTYLFLLNILFPFQMITGAIIWLVGTYPAFAHAVGGLVVIAPLHNLGSWMFISFLVAHIYLATTGHTVMAHVRGMVEGYEDVEVPDITGGERV